jgi:hypothetical protein
LGWCRGRAKGPAFEPMSEFSVLHWFLPEGKHLIYLPSGVESEGMTAIASVYTPEGFVIGGDGRRKDGLGRNYDFTTKIFLCEASNFYGVYAWVGQTRIPGKFGLDFDFKSVSDQVVFELQASAFSSVYEYAKEFACIFHNRLISWLPSATVPLIDGQAPKVLILGYVGGLPQMSTVYFKVEDGILRLPGFTNILDAPSSCLYVLDGRKAVYEEMCRLGLMTPCRTLTEGATLINHFIESCAQNPPDDSNTIGGHIHLAKVTTAGAHWVIAPRF